MQFKDDSQQIYSGCWWVFNPAPKYYKLREWLTPPWFITCQVLTTGSLITMLFVTITVGLIFLHCCPLLNHEYIQTYGVITGASMMFFCSMVMFVTAIVFGAQVNDRYWLPRPDQNYLSWGFGFLIISMIVSLVSGVLLFKEAWDTYNLLLAKEDEHTKFALEMSRAEWDRSDLNEEDVALVKPGFSGAVPGFHEPTQERPLPPIYRPKDTGATLPPSYPGRTEEKVPISPVSGGSTMRSDDRAPLTQKAAIPDLWAATKPAAEMSFDEKPAQLPVAPGASAAAAFDRPVDPSAYGYGYDARDNEFERGKSYEMQPTAKFGKSYDRNFERRYSDSSFNEEEETGLTKPERQY